MTSYRHVTEIREHMVENTRVLLCVADVCEIKVWFKDVTQCVKLTLCT